uniref:Uncharacterized protein n=1 Tax=Conchiformibius kuhniae TaxID=211502 RepID=A0A8T9MTG3_9NEIS|nr:hypothetical protein LVJ77_00490 [Conchiformibius kuhniae]
MKHNGQSEPSPTLRTAASVTAARYSLLLMLASLCLPALSLDRNMMFGLGIWVFMGFGWMFPVIGWAVYANLFYWAALLMFRLGGTRSVKALLWITWILVPFPARCFLRCANKPLSVGVRYCGFCRLVR